MVGVVLIVSEVIAMRLVVGVAVGAIISLSAEIRTSVGVGDAEASTVKVKVKVQASVTASGFLWGTVGAIGVVFLSLMTVKRVKTPMTAERQPIKTTSQFFFK